MKQIVKYLIFTIVAVVLLSGVAIAFAQGEPAGPGGPGRGVGGEVTSIDGFTIHVENPHGEATIVTTGSTEFMVNGEAGDLDDVEVGMFVIAEGARNDDNTFTATRIIASDEVPPPPPNGPGGPGGVERGIGGEVTSIEGSTIHVENPRGEATIVTTDSTEFVVNDEAGSLGDIEVGMFVIAEGERNDDGAFTAARVVASDEAPPPPGGPGGLGRGVFGGEVTSIDGSTIHVENPNRELTIVTTDSTEFVVNGEAGGLGDIEVGTFVYAEGERNDNDDTFTATRVVASDEAPPRAG